MKNFKHLQSVTLSVLLPAYNEEASIEKVVEEHATVLQSIESSLGGWEILCLDDCSTDRTYAILQNVQTRIPQVKVHRHETNQGIYRTFVDLMRLAQGSYLYQTASDGQWPAENMVRMLEDVDRNGTDFVIGVRENRKEIYSLWRQALSYGFNKLPEWFFGIQTKDANGIKLGRKEIFVLPLMSDSFFGEIERIVEAKKKGYKISTVPIVFLNRTGGKAKGAKWRNIVMSIRDFFRYLCVRPENPKNAAL